MGSTLLTMSNVESAMGAMLPRTADAAHCASAAWAAGSSVARPRRARAHDQLEGHRGVQHRLVVLAGVQLVHQDFHGLGALPLRELGDGAQAEEVGQVV